MSERISTTERELARRRRILEAIQELVVKQALTDSVEEHEQVEGEIERLHNELTEGKS